MSLELSKYHPHLYSIQHVILIKLFFLFRLSSGAEFLLQAHDDSEMQQWVGSLKAQCDQTGTESRSQTLPASSQKDEPKRRSFFTLKKK